MAYYDRIKGVWRAALQVNGRRKGVVLRGEDGRPVRDARGAERAEARLRGAMERQSMAQAAADEARRKGDDAFGRVACRYLETVNDARQHANKAAHVARLVAELGAATPVGEITEGRALEVIAALERQRVLVYVGGPKGNPKDSAQWRPRINPETGRPATLSKLTLRAAKITLGAILGFAKKLGLIEHRPKMPLVRILKRLPNPLRRGEVAALARVAPPHVAQATELAAAFGFRRSEVLGLLRAWVDLEADVVRLPADAQKGREEELLPIPARVRPLLERLERDAREAGRQHLVVYRDPKTGSYRPVKSIKKAAARAMRAVGIKGKRFHDTRGSFVMDLLEAGVDHAMTQEAARHKHFGTTQAYIRLADRERRRAAQAKVDRMHSDEAAGAERTDRT